MRLFLIKTCVMLTYLPTEKGKTQSVFLKTFLSRKGLFVITLLIANLFFNLDCIGQGTMGRWQTCGLSGTTASVTATVTAGNVTFSTLTRGGGLTGSSA